MNACQICECMAQRVCCFIGDRPAPVFQLNRCFNSQPLKKCFNAVIYAGGVIQIHLRQYRRDIFAMS